MSLRGPKITGEVLFRARLFQGSTSPTMYLGKFSWQILSTLPQNIWIEHDWCAKVYGTENNKLAGNRWQKLIDRVRVSLRKTVCGVGMKTLKMITAQAFETSVIQRPQNSLSQGYFNFHDERSPTGTDSLELKPFITYWQSFIMAYRPLNERPY